MNEYLTYSTAYAELREITAEIESQHVSVDVLAERVERASHLITYCQQKLRATEEQVTRVIQQMEGSRHVANGAQGWQAQ